jgi:hypothetical protein
VGELNVAEEALQVKVSLLDRCDMFSIVIKLLPVANRLSEL